MLTGGGRGVKMKNDFYNKICNILIGFQGEGEGGSGAEQPAGEHQLHHLIVQIKGLHYRSLITMTLSEEFPCSLRHLCTHYGCNINNISCRIYYLLCRG